MRLGIDLDGVVADFTQGWMNFYNRDFNLLQYRAAAVQMLAIAIVVASMDCASSRLRERFV